MGSISSPSEKSRGTWIASSLEAAEQSGHLNRHLGAETTLPPQQQEPRLGPHDINTVSGSSESDRTLKASVKCGDLWAEVREGCRECPSPPLTGPGHQGSGAGPGAHQDLGVHGVYLCSHAQTQPAGPDLKDSHLREGNLGRRVSGPRSRVSDREDSEPDPCPQG